MSYGEQIATLAGYLEHKGRKKVIPFWYGWRRWYCVLNGSVLLFYKSESNYYKMGKCQDTLDLRMAYDVQTAPGEEHCIKISTHYGRQLLRARDKQSHKAWLESLQAAIVLRREEADQELATTGTSRKQKAKSTGGVGFAAVSKRDKIEGSRHQFRFSLDFIPGQGKKYPTHDGLNLPVDVTDRDNERPNENSLSNTSRGRTKLPRNSPRPISQSLSSFIILNSSSRLNNDEGHGTREKRRSNVAQPRLPTSVAVDKMLSHIDVNRNSTVDAQPSNRHSRSMNNLHVTEDLHLKKRATSADNRSFATIPSDDEPQREQQTQPIGVKEQAQFQEEVPYKREKREKKKNTFRRRSSLAMIKQFFTTPARMFKRSKGDLQDTGLNSLPTIDITHEKTEQHVDAGQKSEEACKSADDEKQRESRKSREYLSQMSDTVIEEPCIAVKAFECDVKVIAVVEPPQDSSFSSKKLDDEASPTEPDESELRNVKFKCDQRTPPPVIIRTDSKTRSILSKVELDCSSPFPCDEPRPPLPVKTKAKCPSPDYDIPRNNKSIFSPSHERRETILPVSSKDTMDLMQDVSDAVCDATKDSAAIEQWENTNGRLHAVQLQRTTTKSPNSLQIPNDPREGEPEEIKRLSYASSKTEIVEEERVKDLSNA